MMARLVLVSLLLSGFQSILAQDRELVWQHTGGPNGSIASDALDATDDGRLLLGTNRGLFISVNGGPWQRATSDALDVETFTVDDQGTIFIGTTGQGTQGLLRSDDGGATWTLINGDLAGPLYVDALSLSASNELYAATSAGIYRSSDRGDSWMKATPVLPAGARDGIYDLAVEGHSTVYVGMMIGIYRSFDRGETWTYAGLPFTDVHAMACDTQDGVYAGASNASLS